MKQTRKQKHEHERAIRVLSHEAHQRADQQPQRVLGGRPVCLEAGQLPAVPVEEGEVGDQPDQVHERPRRSAAEEAGATTGAFSGLRRADRAAGA